jgi:transcriptional regulator with XRE-family HTH domain
MQKNRNAHFWKQDMFFEISNMKILAQHIVDFREANGLSQEAFADMCHLHRTYIGSIERYERNVSINTLEVIAKALGIPLFLLFIPVSLSHGSKTKYTARKAVPPPDEAGDLHTKSNITT